MVVVGLALACWQAPLNINHLEMTISNDAGVLGRVCTIVGDLGANISDMGFRSQARLL